MKCTACGVDVGNPDIGDNSQGGTPAGICITLCSGCLAIHNGIQRRAIAEKARHDAEHTFRVSLGGTTVTVDDRDDTPAWLE